MNKIKTIIRKEWAEVFKNRMVLFTVAFLPLLLTAIPIVILISMRGEVSGMQGVASDMPAQFNAFCPANLTQGECFQVYLVSQFMIMFMILPWRYLPRFQPIRSLVKKPPAAWNRSWRRRFPRWNCWLARAWHP